MKARSIADSLVENPTTEGMEASADDLATIATSARAFHKIAAQSMALAKVLSAEKLNSTGKSKHLYKVGGKVTFYQTTIGERSQDGGAQRQACNATQRTSRDNTRVVTQPHYL